LESFFNFEMANVAYFVLVLSFIGLSSAGKIVQIQTRTVDSEDASTKDSITIEIINLNFETCVVQDLDTEDNDFQRGDINSFEVN